MIFSGSKDALHTLCISLGRNHTSVVHQIALYVSEKLGDGNPSYALMGKEKLKCDTVTA